MNAEELLRDETRQWFDRVRADLRAARILLHGGLVLEALFHCQQAADKALQGFLVWNQRPFPKTHDLAELKPLCCAVDTSLGAIVAESEKLSMFAVGFRYPGRPYEPDESEAEEALQLATRVFDEIRRRLPAGLDESPHPGQS